MHKRGWYINLSGTDIPVYDSLGNAEIGKISNNECYICGVPAVDVGWEGYGFPVTILDASHNFVSGGVDKYPTEAAFTEYASNGSSWIATSSLVRKIQYTTNLYTNTGVLIRSIPAGSYVLLDPDNACGRSNNDFISIKAYTINGVTTTFESNGFIDLVPNNNSWLNVNNIILRKG